MKTIDYFLSPVSPWTHLGHARLREIASRHGAAVVVKPVDLSRVFPVSGGLPLKQRAPQRQAYRMMELRRWRDYLGVPIQLEPRFFPVPADLSALLVIAAAPAGSERQLDLAGALLRACWEQDRDISDPATVAAVADENGFDGAALLASAGSEATGAEYDRLTQEAVTRQVFGVPTCALGDELFWGQDRLDFLDRALARA